ncbi:DoxX family protein [Longispora sp. K20-0274]|uniref:DoxX family protein n=1 Tax=Longispora sp. K20-0274 TaxID=3088255 RepID=UPI00399C470D
MDSPAKIQGTVHSLYRVVVGLLFASHGASSLLGVFGGNMGTGGTVPTGTWPGWYAAVIQLAGGTLVLLGVGTRLTALICSGSMAYAYFVVHQKVALHPLQNGGELSILFCWGFLMIVVLGPGPLSVDALISRVRARTAPAQVETA